MTRAVIRTLLAAALSSLVFAGPVFADKAIFEQKCAACHTIGSGDVVGPDLAGVTARRDRKWLVDWITGPDRMLSAGDPVATELLHRYSQVPMPNLEITPAQAESLIDYIASQGSGSGSHARVEPTAPVERPARGWSPQRGALLLFLGLASLIGIVFWRVAASTRNPVAALDMATAYRLRRRILFGSVIIVTVTLAATLSRTPYAREADFPERTVYATAKQFAFVFTNEPVRSEEDLGRVASVTPLVLPLGALVEFRVTSLDVTHGFAIYTPAGEILTQTQAMPGYSNRLRVRFQTPGTYSILCLEYCGLPHHLMRSQFTVQASDED